MHRIPMLMTTTAAFLAVALAGCTTGGGTEGSADPDSGDPEVDLGFNGTYGGGNVTADPDGVGMNGSGPGGNFSREWRFDNRTGTIDAGLVPVAQEPEAAEETITVENGTDEMYLNVSVEGADVSIMVRAPDCPDEACAQTESASADAPASLRLSSPAEGEWTVEIHWDGDDLVNGEDSDYDLGIAQALRMDGGNPSMGSPDPPY